MKRVIDLVAQLGDWRMLAVLTLTAWAIDLLMWFPRMHPATSTGFTNYLSHSWYTLPVLFVIVISYYRLRHHVGTSPMAPENERNFPAQPLGQVPSRAESGQLTTDSLWKDLPFEAATLAEVLLVSSSPVERDLTTFLWHHPNIAMTATDLAAQVGYPESEIVRALRNLSRSNLVRIQRVNTMAFYKLTSDTRSLERLAQFISWRASWLTRAQQIQRFLGPKELKCDELNEVLE